MKKLIKLASTMFCLLLAITFFVGCSSSADEVPTPTATFNTDAYLAFSDAGNTYNNGVTKIANGARLTTEVWPGEEVGYGASATINALKHEVKFNVAANLEDGEFFGFSLGLNGDDNAYISEVIIGVARKDDGANTKYYVNIMNGVGWLDEASTYASIISGREVANFNGEVKFVFDNDYQNYTVRIAGETFTNSVYYNVGDERETIGMKYLWFFGIDGVTVDLTKLNIA